MALRITTRSGSHFTRRNFCITVGALPPFALGLPGPLSAGPYSVRNRNDTAVILFWLAGGPSHIDMYDLKPGAPAEVRGPFRPIDTNLAGFPVCELLPSHARVADKLVVLRSLHHTLSVHDDASHWVQTGYPLLNARERGQQNPAQGSVVARLRGANAAGIPSYVCVPDSYRRHVGFYQTASWLGARYDPVDGGGDPALGHYRLPDFALPAEITAARLDDRKSLLGAIDSITRTGANDARATAMDEARHQAFELVAGERARTAFDLNREPAPLREKYGRHAWGQAALLARRLVEAGVTFITVNLYEKDVDWWDDHYAIEKNLRKRLPIYDQAFCTLIEDLHQRGLADRTLVVSCGEFGRAPRIDKNAGRGHWPRAMTAILSGGGIRGGQIVGATTPDGSEPADRPLLPGDLLATIYRILGIDHDQTLTDRQGRPIRLVENGSSIAELF